MLGITRIMVESKVILIARTARSNFSNVSFKSIEMPETFNSARIKGFRIE